jgi:flagellar hook-length control protein FliK
LPARATDAESTSPDGNRIDGRPPREVNGTQRGDGDELETGADRDAGGEAGSGLGVDDDIERDAATDDERSDAAAAAAVQQPTPPAEPARALAGGLATDGTAPQESTAGQGVVGGAIAVGAPTFDAALPAGLSEVSSADRSRVDVAAGAPANASVRAAASTSAAAASASESASDTSPTSDTSAAGRSTPTSNAPAQTARNTARAADTDPLARLLDQAQAVLERSQSAPVTDAIAGRLAEVENTIARARAAQSLDEGRVTMTASDEASAARPMAVATDAEVPMASADMGAGSSQPTSGREVQVPQQVGSTGAGSGAIGATNAGTAFSGPAADLASVGDGEPHPAAQLAAKGVGLLANQRGGAITMRLEPPALGALRIELMVRHGAVVADFTAATPEARVLLEANLGMLRERLESQGLSVERISVHGGRGTESAAPVAAQGGGDARQDGASARSDSGDRGERSGTRQDAAGGESRGRRDGEPRGGRERTDAQRQDTPRGFAAALSGVTAQRTEPMRRAG